MTPAADMALSSLFRLRLLLPLLLVCFLAMPPPAAAQGYRNVSLGSSLTTQGTTAWLSPSGDFAFGFLPTTGDSFLLAVWFANIPEKTPVWFLRKGGTPPLLRAGSRVDFTNDGLLVLTDHADKSQWTAPGAPASYAAMLDTGNFVLVGSGSSGNGDFRWETFAYPIDTILPTQKLPLGTNLVARLMDTDYSNGRFKLAVQGDGIVLYPISVPKGQEYSAYWSSGTKDNGTVLVFDASGNVYMANRDGRVLTNVTSGDVSATEYYQRATLDPDGLFRHYRYRKNTTAGEGGRLAVWDLSKQVPEDICDKLTTDKGSGACGYNALCRIVDQRPQCSCPDGYSFIDPDRKYMGCKPDFPPQSCSSAATSPTGYTMNTIQNADWPFQDYENSKDVDEDTCRDDCLKDCFCAAAIYSRERECWRKKQPLSNGRMSSDITRKALLKISSNISSGGTQPTLPPNQPTNQSEQQRGIPVLPGALVIGGLIFIILMLVAAFLFIFYGTPLRRMAEYQQQQQHSDLTMLDSSMRRFTYKELEQATDGFKEELGRGAFGIVYKGAFSGSIQIAAKKLDMLQVKDEQAEKEFVTEVKAIGLTHHKNLVRLLGYCNEGSHRLLVYEFLSNGSLMNLLFGSSDGAGLGWVRRATIACGIARGLFYLHEECDSQIIHCDIKPQNVLLDERLNPKISDFGMAKLLGTEQTRTATGIRGTKGYVAPEWFRPVPVTAKVDVYSFGVMLLELVCCKRAIEPVNRQDNGEPEAEILTDWVYDCYREGRLDLLIGDDPDAKADTKRVQRFVMTALWCIQEDPALRPSMKKVTQMLEGVIEVSVPPDPSSYFSSIA